TRFGTEKNWIPRLTVARRNYIPIGCHQQLHDVPRPETERPADVGLEGSRRGTMSGASAGRVTALDWPAQPELSRVALARSHLTRPKRLHASDHLLSV